MVADGCRFLWLDLVFNLERWDFNSWRVNCYCSTRFALVGMVIEGRKELWPPEWVWKKTDFWALFWSDAKANCWIRKCYESNVPVLGLGFQERREKSISREELKLPRSSRSSEKTGEVNTEGRHPFTISFVLWNWHVTTNFHKFFVSKPTDEV